MGRNADGRLLAGGVVNKVCIYFRAFFLVILIIIISASILPEQLTILSEDTCATYLCVKLFDGFVQRKACLQGVMFNFISGEGSAGSLMEEYADCDVCVTVYDLQSHCYML